MKTENEMNNNGQRTPAAGNGTRKPNFRHKNYRYKAQPKKEGKDGQKQGQDKQTKGNYKPQFRGQGKPALKRPRTVSYTHLVCGLVQIMYLELQDWVLLQRWSTRILMRKLSICIS